MEGLLSNQLVINVTAFETRVALLENSVVIELFIERGADKGLLGNIYLGKVQRVLPGMQAAFVELGLDKAAFLYAGDIVPPEVPVESSEPESEIQETGGYVNEMANDDELVETQNPNTTRNLSNPKTNSKNEQKFKIRRSKYKIENLLSPGQQILVQVTKDPIGTKGPRITCNISIPGRHVVYMPTYDHIGISRKIVEPGERERLKTILAEQRTEGSGFVARTVAQKVPSNKLSTDAAFLVSMWQDIKKRSEQLQAPALVQPELDIVLKLSRDMTNDNLEKIIIDDQATFNRCQRFLQILGQGLDKKLEKFDGINPIFDHYSVESEISRGMCRKVWLRSGGYLVIDQAEALVVVDVNTGRFVGRRNLEETILRTNLEAVREVAYQLRLRNVGGMVIIDFIDMESADDQNRVLQALVEALKKDKARCSVVKMSALGLVEMTRQRTRESIARQLCEPCFYCDGSGSLKSKRTIAYEIFRSLLQKRSEFSEPAVVVNAHPEVVDLIYAEETSYLSQIENELKKNILVRPRGSFHQEQFDIFGSATVKVKPKLPARA